jgi:integrase
VFNNPWEDPISYLLCLVIYTTGLRNSEIERMKPEHIIYLHGHHFIHVGESKTENGIRLVPLHRFTWRCLEAYIKEAGKQPGDYIFSAHGGPNQSTLYRKANRDMALRLDVSDAYLAQQRISFYSGRHYWKTLLNSEGLGDAEEYFMGHKVSKDVAKRYNHLDKQGVERTAAKAKEVFKILDRRLFR